MWSSVGFHKHAFLGSNVNWRIQNAEAFADRCGGSGPMRWKNTIRAYGIWLGLSLYTNVVVLALWDWFAVPALHVPDVSYWQIYGVTLLLAILFSPPDSGDRH